MTADLKSDYLKFLSTPSARRATLADISGVTDFSISIHALCEEGDPCLL